jgi:hypothetical protein
MGTRVPRKQGVPLSRSESTQTTSSSADLCSGVITNTVSEGSGGGDFHLSDFVMGLRDGNSGFAQGFQMGLDRFAYQSLYLLAVRAYGDTAGQIGHGGAQEVGPFS